MKREPLQEGGGRQTDREGGDREGKRLLVFLFLSFVGKF